MHTTKPKPGRDSTLAAYWAALRRLTPDVRLFLVSAALMGLCWKGIYGVLFNLYLVRLGFAPREIGGANALPTLAYGLACFPAGILGNRWGARKAMIVGELLVVAGLGLPPCAEWVPASRQYAWLVATYSVAWVGAALVVVNSSPFLMNSTGDAERSHAFSLQVGAWPMAGFAGSLAAGFLPGFFAWGGGFDPGSAAAYRYALFVAAALYVPSIPVLLATDERPGPRASEPADDNTTIPWPRLLWIGLVTLLCMVGDGIFRAFYNVYLDSQLAVPTTAIGSTYAVGLIVGTAAAMAAPILMSRWGRRLAFLTPSLGIVTALVILALARQPAAAAVATVVLSALPLLARPVITVFQMDLVQPAARPAMSAAGTMGRALGWAGASLAGGYLVDGAGYASTFLVGAAVTAAGAALFWALTRRSGALHPPETAGGHT